MEAESVFAAYETDLLSRRVSKTAIREYRVVTSRFKDFLRATGIGLEEVRRHHIQQFFAESGWAPSTQRARAPYLKASWVYAVEELEAVDRPWPTKVRLERAEKREPRTIPNQRLREIKAGISDSSQWALFHLFAYTGMRRAEIASLEWANVSFKEQTVSVIGKGNKERVVPMHPEVSKALRALGVFAKGSPYVVPGRRGQATVNTVHEQVKRMAPDVSCHDFRRTVASSLENNEAREAAIFQIMGWSADGSLRLRNYTLINQRRLYMEILKLYADDPL